MNIIVSDRESMEHGIVVRSSYIAVSIRDPDKKKARIPKQPGLREVLYLAFHDAEPVTNWTLPDDIRLMTAKHAKRVWAFILKHQGQVGTVVFHCEQGVSRSPAVAAAVCRSFGGDAQFFFENYQPNEYVYRLMLRNHPSTEKGNAK